MNGSFEKQIQKKTIRQQVRQLRKNISPEQAEKASHALVQNLRHTSFYAASKKIACFLSFDAEINTAPLIEMLLRDKDICYLPKLKPTKPNRLWFMPYKHNTKLDHNRLGIPEVDLPINHALAVSKLDIILMPLVAFDEQGNRLGMGGGYYDATLAHLKYLKKVNLNQKPLLIGIAYQQQLVKQLPTDSWDIGFDGVITQDKFYQFRH